MSRPPRLQIAGLTFHVVHRGNHRERVFFTDDDFRSYLHLLALMSSRYKTRIHAYVLMTNHVHLLMTAARPDGVSRTMQGVAGGYSRSLNERLERQGPLWEGRFRSSLISSEHYCLACYRYIELNPVRAGIVASPADYRWSSYRENTGERTVRIVEPHECYLALGESPLRFDRYRRLVDDALPAADVTKIRDGLRLGVPIGGDRGSSARTVQAAIEIRRRGPGRPRRARAL